MSTKLSNLKKSPTKPTDILILETVGLNHIPLSSTEITNKIMRSKDVHRCIRKLCPLVRESNELLFNLKDIKDKDKTDNSRYKLNLIKQIKNILIQFCSEYRAKDLAEMKTFFSKLFEKYDQSNYSLYSNKEYSYFINSEIKITYEKNKICIYFENCVIQIEINNALLSFKFKDKFIFKEINLIKKENNKTVLSFYSENRDRTKAIRHRLLDVSLSEEVQNEINNIKNEISKENSSLTESDLEYYPEIESKKNDTKNWRYSINLRGLIYYLNYNKNRKSVILKILTNPNLLKHAHFLYNCKFFNDFSYPLVRKMIDIAQDYPNIINSGYYDDEKLEQSVRYRFIDEVKKYYSLNRDNVLLNKDLPQEFKDYLDFMLGNQNNDFKEIIQSNEKILNQLI